MQIGQLGHLIISIHPPRGGWDAGLWSRSLPTFHFNPPTPWGVGLRISWTYGSFNHFNPPTPWGVGRWPQRPWFRCPYFNPPTPWGVGQEWADLLHLHATFQSTHPVGGGTVPVYQHYAKQPISIHPPRGGWDTPHPCPSNHSTISIHPPRGGWDCSGVHYASPGGYFNPPTPWGVGQPCSSAIS